MLENQTVERTYKGTWSDVLAHRDEIPETSEVEVRVLKRPSEAEHVTPNEKEDELEGKTLADLFEGKVGVLSFEPIDLARKAEEYLADGFGLPPERRRTRS